MTWFLSVFSCLEYVICMFVFAYEQQTQHVDNTDELICHDCTKQGTDVFGFRIINLLLSRPFHLSSSFSSSSVTPFL